MAYQFLAAKLAACFAFLVVVVVAAQDNMAGMPNNMPGMYMAPASLPVSQSTLTSLPSAALALLGMVVSFLVLKERV